MPYPIDIRIQKVSGIGIDVDGSSQPVQEGSQNGHAQSRPGRPTYPKLILERGLVLLPSPLNIEIKAAIFGQEFKKHHVQVFLLSPVGVPLTSYFFYDAWPVKWSATDLDADQNQIMIERIEMRYEKFQIIGL